MVYGEDAIRLVCESSEAVELPALMDTNGLAHEGRPILRPGAFTRP